MKDISFRPTRLIMSIFEQIRKLDNLPNTDRNSITERALVIALKNKNLDWKFISTITVEEDFKGSIPKHIVLKVDEEKFNLVNEDIKNTFNMEKVTIPYTLKLLLSNYLSSLSSITNSHVAPTEIAVPKEIDLMLLKSEYVQSFYSNKKRLFEACKIYLKENIRIQKDLTERAMKQHQHLNKFLNLSKYYPDKRTEFGTPTATYLIKVLAGWFIFMVESQYEPSEANDVLDYVVKNLEEELQIKNGSLFEKMRSIKDAESADYYKNVYARMMSR